MKLETPNKGFRKSKNALKAVLAAGMLFTGRESPQNSKNEHVAFGDKAGSVSELVFDSAQKEEKISLEAERKMFIEKTGYDMVSIAEKSGFTARLDVDNGTGPYIVHIGQKHIPTLAEKYYSGETKLYQDIISVQKNIELILLAFSKQGNNSFTNVFSEGFTEKKNIETPTTKSIFLSDIKKLSKISPGKGCFLQVFLSYLHIEDDFHDFPPSLKIALTYIHKQKLNELQKYFIIHPEEYNLEIDREFKDVQKRLTTPFDVLGKDAIYLSGAVDKLFIDGKINPEISETEKGSDDARKSYNDLLEAEFINGASEEKITSLKASFDKKALDVREDIALELIEKRNSILKQKIIPLVFGYGHNFTRATRKYNEEKPNNKFGLITFIPKEK